MRADITAHEKYGSINGWDKYDINTVGHIAVLLINRTL
jgi:hypothetical protein